MNPGRSPERLVTRRLRALARTLPDAIEGHAAGVHKARVATRRIREALPVALADVPSRKARKLRRAFRQITRALGPVRELDVALGLVADLQIRYPERAAALGDVASDIEVDRRERRDRMLARLGELDFEALVERLGTTAARRRGSAGEPRSGHAAATVLTARLARRARDLQRAVDQAGALYAPEAIHAVRIAAKKLRYALELAADLRLVATRRPIERLKIVQETLGQLHDRQVLIERVQRVQARVPPGETETRASLSDVAGGLEQDCRELHATYVTQRDRLVAVSEAALEALGRAAAAPEPEIGATVH